MNKLIKAVTNEYELYLKDESRKSGYADSISMPQNEAQISEILRLCAKNDIQVTVQGSRTGVGAGAVPFGGHIMSLERLKSLKMGEDGKSVIAGSAVTLNEINSYIKRETGDTLFLPPDPTEGTASAGGMVSCNSSGARTYGYGSIRNYVKKLHIVLPDGRQLKITRGTCFAKDRSFEISSENGENIRGQLPQYSMPKVKNAAGYFVADNMDMIDLFIGAEGTLGVITEVEFTLVEKPRYIWGVIAFFDQEGQGINFAQDLKLHRKKAKKSIATGANIIAGIDQEADMCAVSRGTGANPTSGIFNESNDLEVNLYESKLIYNNIRSIEFFDGGSLNLLREKKRENSFAIESKELPDNAREAVFIEITGKKINEVIDGLKLIEAAISRSGGEPDYAWVAGSSRSFKAFKELRHATPECVNEKISGIKKQCPQITKLGSDMAVKDEDFQEIVRMYKSDLENNGFKYVMFGHIGNNHLHVNIISRNAKEYELGKELFNKWAEIVSSKNGSVSAEHGVGKLKREYLLKMYGEKHIQEMKNLKKSFDSKGILDRDNIFLWKS